MKKLLANDTFLKILSLLLAVGLWVFVLYTEKPTTDKEFNDIPVAFEGENTLRDNGLIIYEHEPLQTDVTLSGARTQIARVSNEDIKATLSVANITRAGEYNLENLNYTVRVDVDGVNIVSRTPSSSVIKIENRTRKSLPVTIVQNGAFSDPNAVLATDLFVDYITVTGPESIVNGIEEAAIEIDLDRVKDGEVIESTYRLIGSDGRDYYGNENIETNFDSIKVTCHIYQKRVIDVSPITSGNPNAAYAIESLSAEPQTVTIAGEKSIIEALSNIETEPVKINSITRDIEARDIKLALPETVYIYEGDETVTVNVKVVPSKVEEIPVTFLECVDSDDQSRFVFNDAELIVSVSGAPANLAKAEIRATIDISKYTTPGPVEVPVTVTTSGPYLTVQGTYKASITILN